MTREAFDDLWGRLAPLTDEMIGFAQRLIRTPSLPGKETEAAALLAAEMQRLGYDDVWTDRAGSVVGRLRGCTSSHSLMLNAHLDHVAVGDEAAWAHPPYSGAIVDGELWGRGAVDLKGSLAAMTYGVAGLKHAAIMPPWDVYVAGVVLEEEGGLGSQVLLESMRPDFVVIGEATGNQLALGHRGGTGVVVEITGRAAHAAMVEKGINPHYSMARFILGLGELEHKSDPMLGPSTAAPTLYSTDQISPNVIPGRVRLYLDWRSVPDEAPEWIIAQVDALLQRSLLPGATGTVSPRHFSNRTYTGQEIPVAANKLAVKTDPQSVLARRSQTALQVALRRDVELMVWKFCTDGALCAEVGVPIVGFGPGDQTLAHTSHERVALAELQEAMIGDAALALSPALADC